MIFGLPPEADIVTGRSACLINANTGSRLFWALRQIERLSAQFFSWSIHARVILGKSGALVPALVPKTVTSKMTRIRRFSGAHSPDHR
jgi:hypothetical protein